jgi:glycosyltransferase involved in cell wall biosynthesis
VKPVLLVTGHAPPDRAPAFAALHEREGIEVVLFGGRSQHGAAPGDDGGPLTGVRGETYDVPVRRVAQRAIPAAGEHRAVIAGIGGRVALPLAALRARRARVPFLLWASLWAHPRSLAHAASYVPTRALYVTADAVVAYGEHVAAYVRGRGARNIHLAPQAVDPAFWGALAERPERRHAFQVLFAGRDAPGKGLDVLRHAWPETVVVQGESPANVRNFMAGSDVLVVPSVRTATFREPWALVVNEAMHQGLPVIATTEVGAAAGGLVRHERNGLVVPAGDARALRVAIERLRDDAEARATLGRHAGRDVAAYSPETWAAGVSAALASVGASRRPDQSL